MVPVRTAQEGTPQRIAVSIGPQFGTVDPDWIRKAAREATHGLGFDLLLVCAFAFDPQAVKDDRGVRAERPRATLPPSRTSADSAKCRSSWCG